MRSFALDLGNDVQTRFLVGAENVLIVDRSDLATCQVEAVPLSTFDPFDLAADADGEGELVPIDLVHGTEAGRIATLEIAAAQMQRQQGLENSQDIKEWPLRLVPQPVAGNDQWTLTLT